MTNSYSHKQVTAILNIAGSTVYKLVNDKILEVAPVESNVTGSRRYTKQSVDAAKERLNPDISGLKIVDFAKKNNYSTPRVYTAIKNTQITIDTITIHNKSVMYLSSENQAILLKELSKNKHKSEKRTFYNKEYTIALYQGFKDTDQAIHRVKINEANEWGFYVENQFIPFEKAVKTLNLKPFYTISNTGFKQNKSAYVDFLFATLHNETFKAFLDFSYAHFGIEHMHLALNVNGDIELAVKETSVAYDLLKAIDITTLQEALINGEITVEADIVAFQSHDKTLTLRISKEAEALLHKEQAASDKSHSIIVDTLIKKHLKNN